MGCNRKLYMGLGASAKQPGKYVFVDKDDRENTLRFFDTIGEVEAYVASGAYMEAY
jgi:hypothetical protein